MNDKEMERFIDSLTSGEKKQSEATGPEEMEIEVLWDDLGMLREEDVQNDELVSDFRSRLDSYREGWAAAQSESQSGNRETVKGWRPLLNWGIAALLAVSFLYTARMVNSASDLQAELVVAQESLAVSLLEQTSASSRLKGLNVALQVEKPGEELQQSLLQILSSDPNLNVRLAAISMTDSMPRDEAISVLADRIQKESSPLLQLEILRKLLGLVGDNDNGAMNRILQEAPLAPRIRDYLEESEITI